MAISKHEHHHLILVQDYYSTAHQSECAQGKYDSGSLDPMTCQEWPDKILTQDDVVRTSYQLTCTLVMLI